MVGRRAQIFVDVFNVFNRRQLSFNGFVNGNDQNAYLRSIHLPESDDYSTNIPGVKIDMHRIPRKIPMPPIRGIALIWVFLPRGISTRPILKAIGRSVNNVTPVIKKELSKYKVFIDRVLSYAA